MTYSYFPVTYEEMGSLKSCTNINQTDILILDNKNKKLDIYNKFHNDYSYTEKDLVIKILKGYNHPKDGVYIYRIEYMGKSLVFATDVESYIGGDIKLIKFSENADILIHDAAYDCNTYLKKQGWGHSTSQMAAENAKLAKVKNLFLTHYDPEDMEIDIENKLKEAKKVFKDSNLGIEGLVVDMFNIK